MNYWIWVALPGLLAMPALAANKCVETNGRIFYQDAPCPPNTHGGDLRLNVNRPFTGQSSRLPTAEAITMAPESGPQNEAANEAAPNPQQFREARPQ